MSVAQTSTARSQRHGAVVVKNGNVIALAPNKDVNHPGVMDDRHIRSRACVHAEVNAIRRVRDPRNTVVFVARWGRCGAPALSRPCPACEDYLRAAGVKKVVHT